jgi:hypothetical protein
VLLAIVPVAQLVDATQRFRCEPYSAIIRAELCVNRQAEQGVVGVTHYRCGNKLMPYGKTGSWNKVNGRAYSGKCGDCEQGRSVQRRVGAGAAPIA